MSPDSESFKSQSPVVEDEPTELVSNDFLSQLYQSPVYMSQLLDGQQCSFSHWVAAVLVVDFDVNAGHMAEVEYPAGALKRDELARAIRMSFPDSNSLTEASSFHGLSFKPSGTSQQKVHFQKRSSIGHRLSHYYSKDHRCDVLAPPALDSCPALTSEGNGQSQTERLQQLSCSRNWLAFRLRRESPLPLSRSGISGQSFLMGAAYFRTSPSIDSKRGAKQESLAVLSPLPPTYFFSLLLPLTAFLARSYFEHGPSVIYDSCASIAYWPFPSQCPPGTELRILTTANLLDQLVLRTPGVPEIGTSFSASRAGQFWGKYIAETLSRPSQQLVERPTLLCPTRQETAALSHCPGTSSVSSEPAPWSRRSRANPCRVWTPRAITALWSLLLASEDHPEALKASYNIFSKPGIDTARLAEQGDSTCSENSSSESVLSSLSSFFGYDSNENLQSTVDGSTTNRSDGIGVGRNYRSRSTESFEQGLSMNYSDNSSDEEAEECRMGYGHHHIVPFTRVSQTESSTIITRRLRSQPPRRTDDKKAKQTTFKTITNVSRLGRLRGVLASKLRRVRRGGRTHFPQRRFWSPPSDSPCRELNTFSNPSVGVVESLGPLSTCLWTLWEAMITESALLVIASNATRASLIVLHLLNLISPLHYGGDYRPYTNAYDPDLQHYSLEFEKRQHFGLLLGGSDPLLLQLLGACPNVMVVECLKSLYPPYATHSGSTTSPFSLVSAATAAASLVFRAESPADGCRQERVSWLRTSGDGPTGCVPKDPILYHHLTERMLPKSPDFAKFIGTVGALAAAITPPGLMLSNSKLSLQDLNNHIQEHFRDLTLRFLRPFDLYLEADLKPLMINPIRETPCPPQFVRGTFLESLRTGASIEAPFSLMPKSKLLDLYKRFLQSGAFKSWFPVARRRQNERTKLTHLAYCAATTPLSLSRKMTVAEIAEGCAHVQALVRECRGKADPQSIMQVESVVMELKKHVSHRLPPPRSVTIFPPNVSHNPSPKLGSYLPRRHTRRMSAEIPLPTTGVHSDNDEDAFLSACED